MRGELLRGSVAGTCCEKVLWRSVVVTCCREVLGRSVVGKCVWGSVVEVF